MRQTPEARSRNPKPVDSHLFLPLMPMAGSASSSQRTEAPFFLKVD